MAFSFIGQTATSSASGAVATLTRSIGNGNGGFLLLTYQNYTTALTISSLKDQSGNSISYTSVHSTVNSTANPPVGYNLLWVPNFGSSVTSVVLTVSGTPSQGGLNIAVAEFSGLTTTLAITSGNEAAATANATNATDNISSGSMTPTFAGSGSCGILFGFGVDWSSSTSPPSTGTGFTGLGANWASRFTPEYKRLTSTASVALTATNVGTNGNSCSGVGVIIDEASTAVASVSAQATIAADAGYAALVSGAVTVTAQTGTNASVNAAATVTANPGYAAPVAGAATVTASPGYAGSIGATGSIVADGGYAATVNGQATVLAVPFIGYVAAINGQATVSAGFGNPASITGFASVTGYFASQASVRAFATIKGYAAQPASIEGRATLDVIGILVPTFFPAIPLRTITAGKERTVSTFIEMQPMRLPVLPAKTPDESVAVNFDYTNMLPVGVAITGANVGCGVYSGDDPQAGGSLVPSPASINGNIVSAIFADGLNSCTYTIECLAACSDGETLALLGMLPVVGFISEVTPISGTPVITDTGALWVTDTGSQVVV